MITIVLICIFIVAFIRFLVIVDVILSWISLFGVRFRPKFIAHILDPIYKFIRRYIPTQVGIFELTPIIVLFGTFILESILLSFSPEAGEIISSITSG